MGFASRQKIAVTSILLASVAILIERKAGIGINYHPDAVTYLTKSNEVFASLVNDGWWHLPNKLYYVIAVALGNNPFALICLNVITYAATNQILYNRLNHISTCNLDRYLILAFVLMPYRMHLSIHVLKDTLLIFFLVISTTRPIVGSVLSLLIRNGAIIYTPTYLNRKYSFVFSCLTLTAFFVMINAAYPIVSPSTQEMVFRDYDHVPNFFNYGVFGHGIRAILWPLLTLTGAFVLFGQGILFVPLLISIVVANLVTLRLFKRPCITTGAFISLALIAFIVSGFTTYFRYATPVFTLVPLILCNWYCTSRTKQMV